MTKVDVNWFECDLKGMEGLWNKFRHLSVRRVRLAGLSR